MNDTYLRFTVSFNVYKYLEKFRKCTEMSWKSVGLDFGKIVWTIYKEKLKLSHKICKDKNICFRVLEVEV